MDLQPLGWSSFFDEHYRKMAVPGRRVGRVSVEQRGLYKILTETEEMTGAVSGTFRFSATGPEAFPTVGDWVIFRNSPEDSHGIIEAVLPRRSTLARKAAGVETIEQVVAANMDRVFVVLSLDRDYNPRRLERYLTTVWESGAEPVILLSKADLCSNPEQKAAEASTIAPGIPIHVISSQEGWGLEELSPYLQPGQTVALMGSSGAGKSTLTNFLYGKTLLQTGEVRAKDGRGRHTTTHRELVILPRGGILIDTPGLRELQLWDADTGLAGTFQDIETLAKECTFRDCRHEGEPDCAVEKAIQSGLLDPGRLENYRKLQRELFHLELKKDKRLQAEERRKRKRSRKAYRKYHH
ncbi:ribosome small subunit-dependent GTPase A [Kroppenstedtia eburnea]|uniref:ribosome small subunit-dependent GTPase A n=1 Tax=Kroppenstedtia eburnea TaxID=714067 RepID=UPI00363880EA